MVSTVKFNHNSQITPLRPVQKIQTMVHNFGHGWSCGCTVKQL